MSNEARDHKMVELIALSALAMSASAKLRDNILPTLEEMKAMDHLGREVSRKAMQMKAELELMRVLIEASTESMSKHDAEMEALRRDSASARESYEAVTKDLREQLAAVTQASA